MACSITLTYLLWFFFRLLGIHHLYLGRLNHAIVWFATGGGFGIGWLRDLWRIPSYVAWATADDTYWKMQLIRKDLRPYPPCSCFKTIGIFVMGFLAAEVFSNIIPSSTEDDWLSTPQYSIFCSFSSKFLYLIGGVTGIYLVANIGKTRCDMNDLFMGCLYSLPFVILSCGNVKWALLFVGFNARFWDLKWKQLQPLNNEMNAKARVMYNYILYCLASVTWVFLICIVLYLKAPIVVHENEALRKSNTKIWRIPLRSETIININGNVIHVGEHSVEISSYDSQVTSDNIWLSFNEAIDSFLDGLDF